MSYILDALKKIEHEKNKKVRPDGRVSISGDLFQERKPPVARGGIWKIMALIAAASLITCAGTWFVIQGGGRKSAVIISPALTPPPAPINLPTAAPAAPSAVAPVVTISTAAAGDDELSASEVRRSIKQIKVPSPSPKQPAQAAQVPADIKLSGIAWQDELTARRAVVNGFLLKEGAVVSGAKIIDIQADRVRFLSSAGQFELKLDVLPAGGQR